MPIDTGIISKIRSSNNSFSVFKRHIQYDSMSLSYIHVLILIFQGAQTTSECTRAWISTNLVYNLCEDKHRISIHCTYETRKQAQHKTIPFILHANRHKLPDAAHHAGNVAESQLKGGSEQFGGIVKRTRRDMISMVAIEIIKSQSHVDDNQSYYALVSKRYTNAECKIRE